MSEALYAGAAIRRLRRKEDLTQAAMAARLGVSASYLNLIERNRRPLSAQVVVRLVDSFEFDPRALKDDPAIGGIDGLMRRFADPRLADLAIDRHEAEDFLSMSPRIAAGLARLFDDGAPLESGQSALAPARAAIDRWQNHFPDLDTAAELLADEIRLTSPDTMRGLIDRLRDRHQLSVRYLPLDIMPGESRRLDYHARQVQLSEMLRPLDRQHELARQVAELELRDEIDAIADTLPDDDPVARRLLRDHVRDYAASAIMLPYARFLRACEQTGYDTAVLERRFGVGFDTLARRLTTLQRVGQRGLPFFAVTVDPAGQVAEFLAGASEASFPSEGPLCPLWTIHRAFAQPRDALRQIVELEGAMPDRAHWATLVRFVESSEGAEQAIGLGLRRDLASDIHLGKAVQEPPTVIGQGCRSCRKQGCVQRAFPPGDGFHPVNHERE